MIILGVSDGPDAGAALVVNGALTAAVAQERVDRERHSKAFPSGAIDAVLDVAGIRAREVDRIAFGASFSPSSLLNARPGLRARVTPRWREAWRGAQSAIRASGLYMVEQELSRKLLLPRFRALGFERATLELLEHDRAHVTVAYRCQPRADVLIVTLDTPGDGVAVTVSLGRHLQIERLFQQTALASISTFPVRVADLLGIEPSEIGARATGRATPALLATLRDEIGVEGDGFRVRGLVRQPDPLAARLRDAAPEDIAAAALEVMAEAVIAFVRLWAERTRVPHVAVAGAVFADPWLVARLAAAPFVASVAVGPTPGDDGLAIGAALHAAGTITRALDGRAFGPAYTDAHCYKALSVASLPRNKVDDPAATAADLLSRGHSIARFDGGLEIGPARANRAVYLPWNEDAIGRGRAALRRAAWVRPTRVSTDAAGPDVWRPEGDAARILSAYTTRTGAPSLAHLELRLADEPVACTPMDAVRQWRTSDIDALLLGDYLVERSAT